MSRNYEDNFRSLGCKTLENLKSTATKEYQSNIPLEDTTQKDTPCVNSANLTDAPSVTNVVNDVNVTNVQSVTNAQTLQSAEINNEPKISPSTSSDNTADPLALEKNAAYTSTSSEDSLPYKQIGESAKVSSGKKSNLKESQYITRSDEISSLKSSKNIRKVEIQEAKQIIAPEPIRTQNSINLPTDSRPEQNYKSSNLRQSPDLKPSQTPDFKPSQTPDNISHSANSQHINFNTNNSANSQKHNPKLVKKKTSRSFWPWSPYVKRNKSTFLESVVQSEENYAENISDDVNIPMSNITNRNILSEDDFYQQVDICDIKDNNADYGTGSQSKGDAVAEKSAPSYNMPVPPNFKSTKQAASETFKPISSYTVNNVVPPNTPTESIKNGAFMGLGASKSANSSYVRNVLNKSTDSGRSTPLAKKITKEAASLTFLDIPFHQTSSEMSKTERDLLILIMAKAGGAKQYHQKQIGICNFYNKLLGISSQVLALLAGSTGIGTLITATPDSNNTTSLAVVTILTLLSAIFVTLQRGFGFESGVVSHGKSCAEYSHIVTKIARFLSTPDLDRKDIEIFTNNIVLEFGVAESNEN